MRNKVFTDVEIEDDVCYLAQQIREKERPSDSDLTLLRTLCVQLQHDVPPQHQIEMCPSHAPTQREVKKFERIAPIKRGYYTPEEDEIIVNNWKTFCKLHGWRKKNIIPFLSLRDGNWTYIRRKKERRKVLQFLGNGLPNRTLNSIYHRFRTLYGHHIKRRYSAKEDEIILNHIEDNPNLDEKRKFADLAKVLHRTRASIWRRYRRLQKKASEEES